MRLKTALWLPGLAFIAMRKPVAGFVCLGLQATVLGWPLAAAWAARTLIAYQSDRRALLISAYPRGHGWTRPA